MDATGARWPSTTRDWCRLIGGLGAVFVLFHWIATALGSDYGQAGLLVAAIVLAATVGVEYLIVGESPQRAVRLLGLGTPAGRGLSVAIAASALLLLVIPGYTALTGTTFRMYPGWTMLVPGLFAQAGIAEETLFRGYLFRHVRPGRSFWRAAVVASGPFVVVHLLLFFTLPWPIAAASVLLASVTSFPFSRLFELGGHTVWAPAVLHFVVQATVKLVVPTTGDLLFPLVWIAASAVVPFLVFLVPDP